MRSFRGYFPTNRLGQWFLREGRQDSALGNPASLLVVLVGVDNLSGRIGEINCPSIQAPAHTAGVFHHGYRLDHGRSKSQGFSIRIG